MKINKLIMAGIMAVAASVLALDNVEIIDVAGRQRYPWNGLVDIDFELDSKATEPYMMKVTVFDNVGKTNLPVKSVFTPGVSTTNNPCMVTKDTTRIVWDAAADLPDGFKCTNVLVSCQDVRSIGISNLYMIVDLSEGTSTTSFPVIYTNCPPVGGWTEEYMTTKLVLRRVEPGTFFMGSALSEEGHVDNEDQHEVTLTKPYYMGVFELTTRQFEQICGGSGGDTKPVRKTWAEIRGFDVVPMVTVTTNNPFIQPYVLTFTIIQKEQATNYMWPTTSDVHPESFMGRLRNKTGLMFDLPTEAQWEFACRAGSELPVNIGGALTTENQNLLSTKPYWDPTGSHYIYVGGSMPNALGLYEMSDDVDEWCLDVYVSNLGGVKVEDPKGGSVAYKSSTLLSNAHVCTDKGVWHETFENVTFTCPESWMLTCRVTYIGWGIQRVVRGGYRSASRRSSAINLTTTGTIFTTGLTGKATKKATYSNPTHGIRVALTVEE